MRRLVHEGTPLHTVATALFKDISLRCPDIDSLPESKQEWICRLLKIGNISFWNIWALVQFIGYLGIEALDTDDEMSQICIYCGIIPEVVLGSKC